MVLQDFNDLDLVFQVKGEPMQTHVGRSVTRVTVDGANHFLKRYWVTPKQVFRRFVAQGIHELSMIDWLNEHDFAGPNVVARGVERKFGVLTRMMFLMREATGEMPLERYCRKHPSQRSAVLDSLARHTANLHDVCFYHKDYSERHLFVRYQNGEHAFRQIDVERATVGSKRETKAAADIKTLACSIADPELSAAIEGAFLDQYIDLRATLDSRQSFRDLYATAVATKEFE